MRSLNEVSINQPSDLIERFALCVDGNINDTSLGFLHSINKENPGGLTDLIRKLRNIQVKLHADALHLIIQVLTDQLKMPLNTMQSIQEFLEKSDKQTLIPALQTLLASQSKQHQSVMHIIDSLAIFSGEALAEQFLRTILIVLSDPQKTSKEAAKWIKSVLNIPYKSSMAQIIQVIAEHLQLSNALITGKTRNMDSMELFLLLKNLTAHTKIILVTEDNKKFIQHLHAAILTIMIYKTSQNAFYDVVAIHNQHPDFSIFSTLQAYQPDTLAMEPFLQSAHFKKYFSQQRYQKNRINQHVFISSLATYIQTAQHDYAQIIDPNMLKVMDFIKVCTEKFQTLDKHTFMQWYQDHEQFYVLEPLFAPVFLQRIYSLADNQNTQHSGRIRANAMQLITLGFSHRSAATIATGAFKPLVNIDITTIDMKNIQAFKDFSKQQPSALRLKMMQEIVLGYLVYNQNSQSMLSIPATPVQRMATLNTPTPKATVPQVFRANPLDRNRMFTPKTTPNEEVPFGHDKGFKSSFKDG
ncbi:MAG: hypothetical protein NTU48_07370 [Legionellales bacterium]|nr:hypothetical protein [Legionellales bacterium]